MFAKLANCLTVHLPACLLQRERIRTTLWKMLEYSQIQCQQLNETSGKIRRAKVLFRIMRDTEHFLTISRTKRKKGLKEKLVISSR
jgi:hypothetical protein